jgi:hypothetical protein
LNAKNKNSQRKDFHTISIRKLWDEKFAIIHLLYPLINMSPTTFKNKMMKQLKFTSLMHGGSKVGLLKVWINVG